MGEKTNFEREFLVIDSGIFKMSRTLTFYTLKIQCYIFFQEIALSKYWLMKSEPNTYSIDDLKKDKKTLWDGIRNYQARNFMMNDMDMGDAVLFYHSNAKPPGVIGLARVSQPYQPDPTAMDKTSKYFDPRSTKVRPIWHCVEVEYIRKFKRLISLNEIRKEKKLQEMTLLARSRLSIQPVTKTQFQHICQMELIS